VPDETRVLLGIDIGSSGVKAVLLDPDRGVVASSSYDVALYSDYPGWAEAEHGQWWDAVCALVPLLLNQINATNANIAAVGVSGMVPAILVLDDDGRPLRRAIMQNDARATDEIREVQAALGDFDLLSLTGSVLNQQSIAPTALWLSRHEPNVWAATKSIQGSYDWMARALGADAVVEHNWALESGLYGFDGRELAEVQAAARITWPTLLNVATPGTVIGGVSAGAAQETGLLAGTPIVVGGADHVLSAYGAGLVDRGDCLVKLGGSGDLLAVSDDIFLDARLYLDSHPIPGKWLPNGCMATSGSLLRWEQALFDHVPLVELDAAAELSAPGALLTLPFFLGEKSPLHDPDLRGVMLGMHLGTTRGDIHRSILEGIAYGFKSNFDVFAQGGLELASPRVTNGGSKSRLWRQILADVLELELVSLVNHPGASFGAAVIAGVGVGVIGDWSYVAGFLEKGETISPTSSNVEIYGERYRQYHELYEKTKPLSHSLARSPQ